MRRFIQLAILGLGVATEAAAAEFFVALGATTLGDGTPQNPWTLQFALTNSSVVAGDTLWLRGGNYYAGRKFTCTLAGTSANPIIIRNYNHEKAVIDGMLVIYGPDCWVWGLEFTTTDSFPSILLSTDEQTPMFLNGTIRYCGVQIPSGARTKLINNIIHDIYVSGVIWSVGATDSELYGNLILNCARVTSDNVRGNTLYVQNHTGMKRFTDNISNNAGQGGIQLYSGGESYINNFVCNGNFLINNGWYSGPGGGGPNFLSGGSNLGTNIVVAENVMFNQPAVLANVELGYGGSFWSATLTNNYLLNGSLKIKNCLGSLVVQSNLITGGSFHFYYPAASPGNYTINNNSYYANTYRAHTFHSITNNVDTLWSLAHWQASGFDTSVSFSSTTNAAASTIIVRPNQYETGRAHVAILNWQGLDIVSVDLSKVGLALGQGFEMRPVQDYFNSVFYGRYYGTNVSVPMTNWPVAQPAHAILVGQPVSSTFPNFGAFVVLPGPTNIIARPSNVRAGPLP